MPLAYAEHAIVNLTVAIKSKYSFSHCEIADGLNEMLRDAVLDENSVVADYTLHGGTKLIDDYRTTNEAPEEGDLFTDINDSTFISSNFQSIRKPMDIFIAKISAMVLLILIILGWMGFDIIKERKKERKKQPK